MELQRARCQLAYWDNQQLMLVNYMHRINMAANPIAMEIIGFFSEPKTIKDAFLHFSTFTPDSVGKAVKDLIEGMLLLEVGSSDWRQDQFADNEWKTWLPEGSFHFLTKDAAYIGGDWTCEQKMAILPNRPAPLQFKIIEGAETVQLPSPNIGRDVFIDTLLARRTHREFQANGVPLQSISELLSMTWGIQGYFESEMFGLLPKKTSPSGGARHPVEVYIMALRVEGLNSGLYHYQAKDHFLEKIISEASPKTARKYCADQSYVENAAALFIMTGVFDRTRWKYPNPRAYRVVLLDAGHLCQTFCLTATRLGLAPFTTAALLDTAIENDLNIDGITESVLYIAGVGLPIKKA